MSKKKEYDIFGRIEGLESITKGLETTEATAKENRAILLLTFRLTFVAMFTHIPKLARAGKDDIMRMLKDLGLSQQMLDILEDDMLKLCETFEAVKRR